MSSPRQLWRNHGLSIVLVAMFLVTIVGQTWAGWLAYNEEQSDHGRLGITLAEYLGTGHFGEATFENWESEFLQMAFYVVLTAFFYQVGSSESKTPGQEAPVERDPRKSTRKDAPWPVRRGGWVLVAYEYSLSVAFALLFLASFLLHAQTGLVAYNEARMEHGEPPMALSEYAASSQFWFESFQNWQSEFLSLAIVVTFTIFLRHRGSPESKPVDAPTWETGE